MKATHLIKQVVPLAVVCSVLLGYQYLGATWSEPTGSAPTNNTDAPINVGSDAQVKNGALSVDALAVFGDVTVASGSTLFLNRICDTTGSNCFSPGDSFGGSGDSPDLISGLHQENDCTELGGTVHDTGSGNICRFVLTSCPMGWSQHESWSILGQTSCSSSRGSCTTGQSVAFANPPTTPSSCSYPGDTYSNCRENDKGEINCHTVYPTDTCTPIIQTIGCV